MSEKEREYRWALKTILQKLDRIAEEDLTTAEKQIKQVAEGALKG